MKPSDTLHDALAKMKGSDISQLPVLEDGVPIGALYEDAIVDLVLAGEDLKRRVAREAMGKPFPVVPVSATVGQIIAQITAEMPAVFIELGEKRFEIITKYDLVQTIAAITEG